MRKAGIQVTAFCLFLVLCGALFLALKGAANPYRTRLSDGSTFILKQVTLTATNFSYTHHTHGRFWQLIEPFVPPAIRQRFSSNTGSFGFGGNGSTNLYVITDTINPSGTGRVPITRLRVSDGTNRFDAGWGASTMGWPNETVHGWNVRAFPRRSQYLLLEFLSEDPATNWVVVARFNIPNPASGTFPQWEPGPPVQSDGDLTVHLASFRSGALMESSRNEPEPQNAARKTELEFTFEQQGRATDHWRVQKLIISDATGNHWFPYLSLENERFDWARGGHVEFFGALWPGEKAWQLEVEASQIGGLHSEEQISFEIPLPAPATVSHLTNQWTVGGSYIQLVAFASPNTDHTGDFQWTAKWWGERKDKVYSLALRASPPLTAQKQRLHVVSVLDEKGNAVKLLEHRGQDYPDQALFLEPNSDVEKIKLTLSVTGSRFVQFRARPKFIERK